MNIIKRFFKSFESNETPVISNDVVILPSVWKKNGIKDPDAMIEHTKRNVPWQIWQHNNHGIDIQGTTPKYEFIDNKRISTYECGCKFEEGLKTFGWSGHWCDKHARRVEYGMKCGTIERPVKQKIYTQPPNKGNCGWVNGNTLD